MKDESHFSSDSKYRWIMLALIWLGYFACGVIIYSIPPLVTPISQDLNLTYSQVGSILGAFIIMYIPLSIPVGIVIDRAGMRKAIIVAVALVPLSAILQSFTADFQTLFLASCVVGIGGPFLAVGSMKIIALWFSGKQRGLASGLSMTGVFIGASVAMSLTNSIIMPLVGTWRSALRLYAFLGFIIALAWLLLARDAPQTQSGVTTIPLGETLGKVCRVKCVWMIIIIAFSAAFFAGYSVIGWLPKMLELSGMNPSEAGFYASIPSWSALIGNIIVPSLAKAGSRKPVLFITLLIQGICIYAVAITAGIPLTASLIFYGISYGASAPLLLVILMDLPQIGAKYIGIASGVLYSIGAMGAFAGPLIVGFLKDSTGTIITGMILLTALVESMLILTLLIKEK